jgi:hypothetical protein
MWKTEIVSFGVPGQYGQKKYVRFYLSGKNLGVVVHTYHPRDRRKHKIKGSWFRPDWVKSKTLS